MHARGLLSSTIPALVVGAAVVWPAAPAAAPRPAAAHATTGATAASAASGRWSSPAIVRAVVPAAPVTTVAPPSATTATVLSPASTATVPSPASTVDAAPVPPVTAAPVPVTTAAPVRVAAAQSSGGCAAALTYLTAHSAPGFRFECPGYALGRQAMTCINISGVCPGEKLIAIAVACPASWMNEASNSWVLSGLASRPIDPYGYCH